MSTVILFHSVYGLRGVEREAAQRLCAAGHRTITPDLFAGEHADSIDEGFELMGRIGWAVIRERAASAMDGLPDTTVLAGVSMGAGVVSSLWPTRPGASGVILLHALADIPDVVPAGLPVQLHIGGGDASFAPAAQVSTWQDAAAHAGVAAEVFTYPGVGHFYTDATLADYDAAAAGLTWRRVVAFLDLL